MNFTEQAVILCGGRGERLRPLTDGLPKPMAPVLGRPFLEYLVAQLRDAGLRRILLLNGYRGGQIHDHFGDGRDHGVEIRCVQGDADWETGRRIAEAAGLLDERFVLCYGDNFAPFRLEPLAERHLQAGRSITLTVAAKQRGNIRLADDGTVAAYEPGRSGPGLHHVEIGYMAVERDRLLGVDPGRGSLSLSLEALAHRGDLAAHDPGVSYQSISDLDRLRELEQFLRPRRLLLVDRDGVINRKAPRGEYVFRREDFSWMPENITGLQRLSEAGFDFIVISNQAGIGRGVVPEQAVRDLHAWMTDELAVRGIRIVDILYCPHHWEDGCRCRKPRPGLFFAASARHHFWLGHTLYIGDDPRDAAAAQNAGCGCVLVGDGSEAEVGGATAPHHFAEHIAAAAPWIIDQFQGWESSLPAEASA